MSEQTRQRVVEAAAKLATELGSAKIAALLRSKNPGLTVETCLDLVEREYPAVRRRILEAGGVSRDVEHEAGRLVLRLVCG